MLEGCNFNVQKTGEVQREMKAVRDKRILMAAVLAAVLAAWGGAAAAAVSLDEAVAAAQRGSGVREIVVRSGVYRLTHPIVLDARASGVLRLRAASEAGL